jgi:hypothetical protein
MARSTRVGAPAAPATVAPVSGSSVDVKLAEISTELKSKPGYFSIFGVVTAAIALPGGALVAWFSAQIADLETSVKEATASSLQASNNSSDVKLQMESLVVAMARSAAMPVNTPETVFAFRRLLPKDLVAALERPEDGLAYIEYADFDKTHFIFMTAEDYNSLDSAVQASLVSTIKSFETASTEFRVRLELQGF